MTTSSKLDFLSIADINQDELWQILYLAKRFKKELKTQKKNKKLLKNKTLAMIFEKPSLRTRISFETGMTQLGGHAIYLGPKDIGLGKRESVADIATVTSSMVDIIMARTFKHEHVAELASHSSAPVINALTNLEHPCQILADLMTIWEIKNPISRMTSQNTSPLKGLKLAFIGDCENNVTHSLTLGCALVGIDFIAAGPKGYHMAKNIVQKAKSLAHKSEKTKIRQVINPQDAVSKADIIVTDTWISMGDEAEKAKRLKIFRSYQVTQKLMKLANKKAIFMHCLPAYRGNEVEAGVIDGPQSVVFQQAENRLHAQKGLMVWLLRKDFRQ